MTPPAKVETPETGTGRTRADVVARDIACDCGETPSSRILTTLDALEVRDLLANGLVLLPPVDVNALVLRVSARSMKGRTNNVCVCIICQQGVGIIKHVTSNVL